VSQPSPSSAEQPDLAEFREAKLKELDALGVDPWGQRFDGHVPIAEVRTWACEPFDDAKPGPAARIAGRIVRRRLMGKVHFLELWDQTGRVQVMLGAKQIGDLGWKVAQLLDLGDLVGVDGEYGKTKTGEPTVRARTLTFLTKSLEPHPKDVFGLSDTEYRLRHRYLDLVYTPDTLRRAHQRVKIVRAIRNYLDSKGFLEVETPVLHAVAGGAAARPFATHHNALDIPLFLRIALELPLKRLLVGGIEKVYEIGRVFRNEGISPKHNPEFTMLELYEAYGDLFKIMDLTEGIFVEAAKVVATDTGLTLPYGEHTVNYTPPFARVKYADLFRDHVGCDLFDNAAVRAAAERAKIPLAVKDEKTGLSIEKEHDVLVHELFEHYCEHTLIGPVFVYDYPAALCPLTKRKRTDPRLAERFELYVRGMELANAYTELNDPITQETTFRQQLAGLPEEDSMAKTDDDFVRALRHGMPPAGGLGVGIDRLVMLLTNTQTIRDVILFPLLRPEA
jgi:lysyl-tRNA synthetase class 2